VHLASKIVVLTILTMSTFWGLSASAQMPEKDTVPEGKDHPLVGRFASAKLVAYESKAFDELLLPSGKHVRDAAGKNIFEKLERVEGKITRAAYNFSRDHSSAEVMRNYQTALQSAGFNTVFSCDNESCGSEFGYMLSRRFEPNWIKGGTGYWSPFNYGRQLSRYLLAKGTQSNGVLTYAAVFVVSPVEKFNGGVYQEIVEVKPVETGKVIATLTAADMATSLSTLGKVAVYGILFDTDKATLKAESKSVLAEMAKLLTTAPTLKVYLVGHTDNQGALARNVELSQQRADAVLKALTGEFKIASNRLSAKGVGPYAPVGPNDTDAGREKNRRVELVKQ
jgi:OmpA-OmpF porin, OOP family